MTLSKIARNFASGAAMMHLGLDVWKHPSWADVAAAAAAAAAAHVIIIASINANSY